MRKLEYSETIVLITNQLSGVMGRDLKTDLIYTRWTEVKSRKKTSLLVTCEQAYVADANLPARNPRLIVSVTQAIRSKIDKDNR